MLIDRLEKIIRGEGEPNDLEIMRSAADTMVKTSLCGLGQAASNPVTSSLNYFLSEYEAHIQEQYCQSGVCKGLFQYVILAESCNGCTLCAKVCPANAIQGTLKETAYPGCEPVHAMPFLCRGLCQTGDRWCSLAGRTGTSSIERGARMSLQITINGRIIIG